jgi:predicted amidohydrolase
MRVAIAQLRCPSLDPDDAVARTTGAIEAAARDGAEVVVLPEMSSGYVLDAAALAPVAEVGDDGALLTAWRAVAREHGVIVVGGFAEKVGRRLFNTAAVIDRRGAVVGRYRKLHLFGAEHQVFTPGDCGLPVFDLDGVRLGVLICYDLRFPEALRILALQGAQVVAVPTAWVTGFDRALPGPDERIGQVDGALVQANLNQVWVACADQVGTTAPYTFLGRSLVVDPYGEPVLGPLSHDTPAVQVADVDLAQVAHAQDRGPGISPRANRRTDVYGELLGYRPPG